MCWVNRAQDVENAQQYFNRRVAFLQKNADQIAETLLMKRNAFGGMHVYTKWWWLHTCSDVMELRIVSSWSALALVV